MKSVISVACSHALSVGFASIFGTIEVRVMVNCFRKGSVVHHDGTQTIKNINSNFRMVTGSESGCFLKSGSKKSKPDAASKFIMSMGILFMQTNKF